MDILSQLTPDQLQDLKRRLDGITDTSGRSKIRPRQLHDLNRKPGADDPRPLFVWSVEQPLDYDPSVKAPFAQLLWSPVDRHGKATEITVYSEDERDHYVGMGYTLLPPESMVVEPMDAIQTQFAMLSEEDKILMIEAADQDRRNRLQDKIANLSEADLEKLMALVTESKPKRK